MIVKYSCELPERVTSLKLIERVDDRPNGYAWICINSTNPPNDPYPYVNCWIYAEAEVISCADDKRWFYCEIEDLLGDRYLPNSSLDYLVEFIWDDGDPSVGIFPGYNCHLVLDDAQEPITRSFE